MAHRAASGERPWPAGPGKAEDGSNANGAAGAFDLSKTKVAIEEAVREASKLPEEQRRKKLNALRLKWHPDKHEMLREIAGEVRSHVPMHTSHAPHTRWAMHREAPWAATVCTTSPARWHGR